MIGRIFSAYAWGHVADRWGRRPVMLCGLCSIAVLSLAFGFATSLVWAIVCRCDQLLSTNGSGLGGGGGHMCACVYLVGGSAVILSNGGQDEMIPGFLDAEISRYGEETPTLSPRP